eukprot:7388179-Prymnesium_polylepis.1
MGFDGLMEGRNGTKWVGAGFMVVTAWPGPRHGPLRVALLIDVAILGAASSCRSSSASDVRGGRRGEHPGGHPSLMDSAGGSADIVELGRRRRL